MGREDASSHSFPVFRTPPSLQRDVDTSRSHRRPAPHPWLTQVTLKTHAARRNAQSWVLQHRTPHLLDLALGHPLLDVAAPRTSALHLLRLVVNMAQRTRWKQQPTETTLAALGDARIQNITFYNTRQLMLHRYFRNEHNPPAHVFLSASSAMLSAVVILQSGRIRKFFDLDGGADVVLSRHVLGVVPSPRAPVSGDNHERKRRRARALAPSGLPRPRLGRMPEAVALEAPGTADPGGQRGGGQRLHAGHLWEDD